MSQRNSGYVQRERGAYMTPHWVTRAFIPHLPKGLNTVWEPAAGTGIMVDALREAGFRVVATDLSEGIDFLQAGMPPFDDGLCDAIITNPPYDLATEFIEHSLRLMEPNQGTVAMLLRTDFDHAKSRTHLFRDAPAFQKKVVLTKRIVWFDQGEKRTGKSPSFNHAVFIWNWRHEGAPTIGYAP